MPVITKQYTVFCPTCSASHYLKPEVSQIRTIARFPGAEFDAEIQICGHVTWALTAFEETQPATPAEPCQT